MNQAQYLALHGVLDFLLSSGRIDLLAYIQLLDSAFNDLGVTANQQLSWIDAGWDAKVEPSETRNTTRYN